MRILHIEDDAALQKVIGRSLQRRLDCDVVTVASPGDAIVALEGGVVAFDIVVSDYNIEGGTGGQVLDWVRANKPDQKFMFLSDDDRIVTAGVPYVRKPATGAEICNAISSLLAA